MTCEACGCKMDPFGDDGMDGIRSRRRINAAFLRGSGQAGRDNEQDCRNDPAPFSSEEGHQNSAAEPEKIHTPVIAANPI